MGVDASRKNGPAGDHFTVGSLDRFTAKIAAMMIATPTKSLKLSCSPNRTAAIATPKNGVTAEVIEVKSLDEAEELGDQLKGKIVFFMN